MPSLYSAHHRRVLEEFVAPNIDQVSNNIQGFIVKKSGFIVLVNVRIL